MITISELRKAFGPRDLFTGASMRVLARDRVALVGPNGSGKTTLLEMIVGEQPVDAGTISIAKDVVIGYLRQETDELRGRPLLDEVMRVGGEITQSAHRLEVLQHEIATVEPGAERDRLLAEYGRLQDRFAHLGGYTIEHEAKRVLGGLGFKPEDLSRMTESFSGGWLMRIALAKLLLASPDLLMLDEPTNHLDVESVEWLERFLATYDGAVLLISHDRDFINGVANKVVEIENTKLVTYTGDYESFVGQREERERQVAAAAKGQQRKVEQTEAFINRFRYKARKAKQVQSRIRSLEKMERVEVPKQKRRSMRFRFPTPRRPGRVVVDLNEVSFAYDAAPVYKELSVAVERERKIALVGPNGAGKSTLLKLIAGVLEPQTGERKLGHNVDLSYFAQHQIEALVDENRVLTELQRSIPSGVQIKARDLLGRFLFSGDDVDKPVGVLSGGERTRLALAKMLVSPANVLCLDEPTNHLDMWSRDVLEDALVDYQGTIVLITHDRHLIRSVADHIIEIVDGVVTEHHGDYDAYLARRERIASRAPIDVDEPRSVDTETPRAGGPKTKEQKRAEAEARNRTKHLRDRLTRIEAELDQVGAELKQMSATLADPSVYDSGADIKELVRVYELAKRRVEKLEAQWEEAARSLEEAQGGTD